MRLVDKLVFKDLIGPFINGLLMFLMLLFAATFLFPATDLLVKGVPLATVVRMMLYSLPSVVTQTFPMAMLLSSLMAFGRLSADREAVALFAAGISFARMIRIVWIVGALVSVAAFFWNDLVVPPTARAYWELQQTTLRRTLQSNKRMVYTVDSPDGQGIEEFVKIDGGFDAQTQTLKRVTITKYSSDPKRSGQPELILYCDRARAYDDKGLKWSYYSGYFILFTPDAETGKLSDFVTVDFEELTTLPDGASVGKTFDEVLGSNVTDPNRKSFKELRAEINAEQARGKDTRGKEVDLYGKISLPLASLIFGIVGAALGLNTQRGGGKTVGFGVAIFIVFLYWVFYHAMFVAGKGGGLSPLLASFLADIVGAVVGFVLMLRASR